MMQKTGFVDGRQVINKLMKTKNAMKGLQIHRIDLTNIENNVNNA